MRIRHVLIVSLGLNLLLTAVFLFRKNSDASHPQAAPPVRIVHQTVTEIKTNAAVTNPVEVAAMSHRWSQLESEDYPTYVANLRAVGCPERTIQHIILEDIEKLYREKEKEEPRRTFSWLTGPERDAHQLERRNREEALFEEKSQVIKSLLGRELDWEARKLWVSESEAAWFLSFITDDQAEQTLAIAHRLGEQMESTLGRGEIVLEKDIQRAEGIYRQMLKEFAKIGTDGEIEEALLRATLGINFGLIGELGTLSLTPEELRKLVSLQLREEDPFKKLMRLSQNDFDDHGSVYSPAFLGDVRQLMGEQRFTDFLCAQDEELNGLRTAITESGGSIATVSKVFEVQQLTLQEAESIRADPNLSRPEKRAELRALQQTAKEALMELGGSKVNIEKGVSWLETLEKL